MPRRTGNSRRACAVTACALALALAGCEQLRIAELDEAYYGWDDRRVVCGVGVDTANRNDLDNIGEGIERAARTGEVLILYGHEPGRHVPVDKIARVLELGDELGVPFISFADMVAGPPRAGVALTFDDAYVGAWYELRDLLREHGARVTLFVTRIDLQSDVRIEQLHELEADGHAIESHGLRHLDAVEYVDEHGLQAYLDDEFLAGLDAMRARGFAPTSFAYPFGSRTAAIDRALLEHVQLVRSLSWTHPYPLVRDPCPW